MVKVVGQWFLGVQRWGTTRDIFLLPFILNPQQEYKGGTIYKTTNAGKCAEKFVIRKHCLQEFPDTSFLVKVINGVGFLGLHFGNFHEATFC